MAGSLDMFVVDSCVMLRRGIKCLSTRASIWSTRGMLVVVMVGFDSMRLVSCCWPWSVEVSAMLLFIEWLSRNIGILGWLVVVLVKTWLRLLSRYLCRLISAWCLLLWLWSWWLGLYIVYLSGMVVSTRLW